MKDAWPNILAILVFFWPYLGVVGGLVLVTVGESVGSEWPGRVVLIGSLLRIMFRELSYR